MALPQASVGTHLPPLFSFSLLFFPSVSLTIVCWCGIVSFLDNRNYSVSKCNSPSSVKIIQGLCLGKQNCSIPVSTDLFGGDPCYGTHKHFSVQATCSPSTNKYVHKTHLSLTISHTSPGLQTINWIRTSWDFTLLDPLMEDFMAATKGHSVIINFSTIPQWMWNTAQPVLFPSDPDQVFWSYEQVSKT